MIVHAPLINTHMMLLQTHLKLVLIAHSISKPGCSTKHLQDQVTVFLRSHILYETWRRVLETLLTLTAPSCRHVDLFV